MWVTTNVGANIFTFIFYYKDQVLMNPFIAVGKDDLTFMYMFIFGAIDD